MFYYMLFLKILFFAFFWLVGTYVISSGLDDFFPPENEMDEDEMDEDEVLNYKVDHTQYDDDDVPF